MFQESLSGYLYLKYGHSQGIDIRASGWKSPLPILGEPEMVWVQYLWRHPPGCTPRPMTFSSGPHSRLVNDHSEPKISQPGRAPRIYKDVGLGVIQVRPNFTPGMVTHSFEIPMDNVVTVQVLQPGSHTNKLDAKVRSGYYMSWCHLQDLGDCDVRCLQ